MEHMQIATAVYENGVLRLPGPLPGFANGDRVEVAVVRLAPIDRDVPGRGCAARTVREGASRTRGRSATRSRRIDIRRRMQGI